MKRWLATITIVLMIIGIVIWEQIYVKRTFIILDEELTTLMAAVAKCDDTTVKDEANVKMITKMEQDWLRRERGLCLLVKHTETFQISDTIIYAKNFIISGNQEEVMYALRKLAYLFGTHHYNMGTSWENII